MLQVPGFDCFPYDPFALFQEGFDAPEVNAGARQVMQALVVAPMVVVFEKGLDSLP